MAKAVAQQFLEFDQIIDGIIILKNKGLRGVLMVSSINFALKPQEEKDALIYLFQDFLNSLDFSLEIYIQSRKLNITGYIDKLKEFEEKQENDLLKTQTISYRQFIEQLVSGGTIMTKNFYCVVPFALIEMGVSGGKKVVSQLTDETFQRAKTQLWQRMEFVALGLKRMGLRAIPLTTPELIELFWALHHPEEAEIGYFPEVPPELFTK